MRRKTRSLKCQHRLFSLLLKKSTCSEVDHDVHEEYRVREAVERDPPGAEVVVEEGDGDGEDDQVGHQQEEHAQVPVESGERLIVLSCSWI